MKLIVAVWLLATGSFFKAVAQPEKPVQSKHKAPADSTSAFRPGALWHDDRGQLINAHGGCILQQDGRYYWFGESRAEQRSLGVGVYSSTDLYHWKPEGIALAPSADTTAELAEGCIMERPKVIFNPHTKKYVMWFHLELRGKGYSAARVAVAVSDRVTGPYRFVKSFRPNGHMSRDMTLFVDDDGAAYEVYSARDNYDMRIVKLTDDYLSVTTRDSLLFSKHREAPVLFRHQGNYYLFTSACTGWRPNKASVHVATSPWGPWTELPGNPLEGPGADTTYGGQPAFVVSPQNRPHSFIFVCDRWNPRDLHDSRYLWLPIRFEGGRPVVKWMDRWELSGLGRE